MKGKLGKLKFGTKNRNMELSYEKNEDNLRVTQASITEELPYGTGKETIHTVFYYQVLNPELYANADLIWIAIDHENEINFKRFSEEIMPSNLACQAFGIPFSKESLVNYEKELHDYEVALKPISEEEYNHLKEA